MAVVKSNAYGHGVKAISLEAVRNGADYLAVARLSEGIELRKEGIGHPTLVCELVPSMHVERAILEDLDLTVSELESPKHINGVAERMKRKAKAHVKVDTGMGRLGLDYRTAAECIESIARLRSLDLVGVYSHFANAEDTDQTFAREQLERFNRVLEDVRKRRVEIPIRHMANSGAILTLPESHFDMVRPGIMLYGYTPRPDMSAKDQLRPVMSVLSKVAFLKTVDANTSVSYGRRYFTPSTTTIATIPIGYGDGYSRSLTGKSEVLIRGQRYPSVGTICMDHLMVNIGNNNSISVDDDVVLIGRDGSELITAWDIAQKLGTIPYEVTCLITPRVPRVYVG